MRIRCVLFPNRSEVDYLEDTLVKFSGLCYIACLTLIFLIISGKKQPYFLTTLLCRCTKWRSQGMECFPKYSCGKYPRKENGIPFDLFSPKN